MAEFFTFSLPNGIRCIQKRTRSAVTHCALTVGAGSRDELPNEYGIAHLVEHSIFKGTERRRAFHINSRLENLGGELNAFTTKEETVVHATTLRSDFAKAAELIADIVFRSTFPEREIEREKQVVVDEINSYRDIPQEMLFDRFEELMFAGSPLGRNILGTARSVRKFDSEALRSFMARTYTPDQMVFSAVGNISEKAFVSVCERYFGGFGFVAGIGASSSLADGSSDGDAARRKFERVAPPPLVPFEESAAKGANHQAHCILGNRAYSLADSRRLPLALLVNILGGPAANSRLNTVLRERNGLSYSVEAMYSPLSDSGFASIYFGCEKENLDRCRELINTELQRVMKAPLTPRQLSMAKKQYIGQFVISMDSSEGYMLGAAKSCLIYNDIDSPRVIARKIEAITADEIIEVASEVFKDISAVIYK